MNKYPKFIESANHFNHENSFYDTDHPDHSCPKLLLNWNENTSRSSTKKNCWFERDSSAYLDTRCRSEVRAAANKRFDWQTDNTCQASLTFSTAKFPPADSERSSSLMATKLSSWLTYRLNYTLNDNAAALTKYRCMFRLYQA